MDHDQAVRQILLTEDEAAKAVNLSRGTLANLRKRGELPFVRLSPKCLRYRVTDLEALAAKLLVTNGN